MRRTNKGLLQASAGRHAARVQSTGKFPFVFPRWTKVFIFERIRKLLHGSERLRRRLLKPIFPYHFGFESTQGE